VEQDTSAAKTPDSRARCRARAGLCPASGREVSMSDEYPLYPELDEQGRTDAVALIEAFKKKMAKVAEEALSDLYCDVLPHIETDAWTNFKNTLLAGLCDYRNSKKYPYEFRSIRKAIFEQFREEIIADLNQDMVDEIARLKQRLDDALWGGR
jgi:hypothetical protein